MITLVSGIRYRTLLLSAASYFIIVLIPYLFGILMNISLYHLTKNEAFIIQEYQELFLRLFRLFIIWYVSILYFHTTPMKTILGLLDKFFFPLKLIKVPVQDYLKVVMCIVMELKGTGEEMKTHFLDHARSVIGGGKLRSKFSGISQIIVSSLVDSFQKLDEMESLVVKVSQEELYNYRFKMTKHEWIAALSLSLLILILNFIEKGNGLVI
jgi:energy-coupling factor transport system permease protein